MVLVAAGCTTGTGFSRLTEASYRVEVRDRYTEATVCVFDEGEGVFTRTLDGTTTAEWIVPADCGACDCPVTERRHELAFIRDDWPEAAWVGPIVRTVDDAAQGTIRYNAVDRLYWWQGAAASRDIIYQAPNERDAVALFEEMAQVADEFADANLQRLFDGDRLPPAAGLLVESKVKAGESVWSAMVGLAKSVIDFTVVGPQLYWGSPEIPIEDGPAILPTHFTAVPILDRDAESVVTQVVVVGAGGVRGVYPANSDVVDIGYGHRTEFISDTNLNNVAEASAAAREIFEQNSTPSTFIITGEGSLDSSFPVPLHELIPGRNFLVTATGQCLEASEELVQLFNVIVEIRTEADPGKRLREYRVAADFGKPGSSGAAERISG